MDFYVIVFESTHYAIAAERVFKKNNCKFDIIPTPREITQSCGLSIRFKPEEVEIMKKIIEEANILIQGIYRIQKINNKKIVNEVI